jgi:hypothetical protein
VPNIESAVAIAAGSAGTAMRAAGGTSSSVKKPRGRGAPIPGWRRRPSMHRTPKPGPVTSTWSGPNSTPASSAAAASTPAHTASTALPRASTSVAAATTPGCVAAATGVTRLIPARRP